jgi:nicotinate-nucleotide adenylyltransferase
MLVSAASGGSGAPRVGVFGGSFNPVHLGHLIEADEARALLALDRVLFVPARVPPHKEAARLLDAEERAALLEIALAGSPGFELSRVDLDREGPSYTVETIRRVRAALPADAQTYLLLGMDSLLDLPGWRSPEEILRSTRLAVFPRIGYDVGAVPSDLRRSVEVLDTPLIDISSAGIRARIRESRPYRHLLPEGVFRRIEERRLYRAGP